MIDLFSILTEVQCVVVASTFSDVSVKVTLNATETSSDRVRTSCEQRKLFILSVLNLSLLMKRSLHFLNYAYTNWTVWVCDVLLLQGKWEMCFKSMLMLTAVFLLRLPGTVDIMLYFQDMLGWYDLYTLHLLICVCTKRILLFKITS